MANVLRLATESQAQTADLLGGTLKLRPSTWTTRTAPPVATYTHEAYGAQPAFQHYPPVVESFELAGTGTAAALLAAFNDVTDLLAQARRWHTNPLRAQSVWLEWNANAEPVKRALVYEGSVAVLASSLASPLVERGTLIVRLTLTRHPLCENVDALVGSNNNLTLWNTTHVPAGPVAGSEPARLKALTLTGLNGGGGPLVRLWAGWRDAYEGTAHFNPLWEAETGTPATDATVVADATASGGSKVQVAAWTTATLAARLTLSVEQVAAAAGHTDYHHQTGRYLVLARAKVSAGVTAGLQLRSGYTYNTTFTPNEEIYITNTAWRLWPLGEVTIPPLGYREGLALADHPRQAALQLWAELAAGVPLTDTLDLDALYLVPAEHLAYCDGADVVYSGGGRWVTWATFADDTSAAYNARAAALANSIEFGLTDFYLPVGSPVLVLAGERAADHVLTDRVMLLYNYLPRWLSYRET